MRLPEICIKRPVFATVLSLVILLVGLISYTRLSVREYPRIDEPVVSVNTTYRGASAEVVESQVTKILEDSLSGIEGVETDDVAEPRGAKLDQRALLAVAQSRLGRGRRARQGVARARPSCPTTSTSRSSPRSRPTRSRSSTSRSQAGLADAARGIRLRQSLHQAAAVGAARARPTCASSASGRCRCGSTSTARASRPTSSPCRTSRTRSAARTRRFRPAASSRRRASSRSSPRPTCRRPSSSAASSSPTWAATRCASATSATAGVGALDERVISRYNGKPSLNIGVIKQAVANPLELSRGVRAEVGEDQREPAAGMKLVVAYDTSVFIDTSIESVFATIAEAIVLVVLVIFFFLRSLRATHHPDRDDPGVADRRVRADVLVRIHDQHADAARDGARDRPRRRRRDRRAGEHLPAHRGRHAAQGRRRCRARGRSRSPSSR